MSHQTRFRIIPAVFYIGFLVASSFSISISQIFLGLALTSALAITLLGDREWLSKIPKRWYFVVGVYTLWQLLSCAFVSEPLTSLVACKESWLFVAVPIGVLTLTNDKLREKAFMLLGISVAVLALVGIIQFFVPFHAIFQAVTNSAPSDRLSGYFSHPLTFANYFGVIGAFCLSLGLSSSGTMSKGLRYMLLVAGVLGSTASVLSGSRIAFIAVGGAILTMALLSQGKRRNVAIGFLMVVVISALLLPNVRERLATELPKEADITYEGGRPFIWKTSLAIVADHPVVGVGVANFAEAYVAKADSKLSIIRRQPHAHNDLLTATVMTGIPGGLLFLLLWIVTLSLIWNNRKTSEIGSVQHALATASLVGCAFFIVASLTEATFYDEEVRQILMFVWASGLCLFPMHRQRA